MILFQKKNCGFIRRYPIVGGRRLSNYWWSVVIFLGGCGFLLTGISSYFNRNLLLIKPQFENVMHTRSYQYPCCTSSIPCIAQVEIAQGKHGKVASSERTKYSFHTCASSYEIAGGLLPCYRATFDMHRYAQVCWGMYEYTKHIEENKKQQAIPSDGLLKKAVPLYTLQGKESRGSVKSQTILSTLAHHPKGNKDELEVIQGIPSLAFFPQGLVLSFYGFLGLCLSFHLWLTLIWKIGAGFNEFNGNDKYVRIFRWGRPGKNRRIDVKYTKEMIETIKIELVPKPALVLHVKGEKDIPLTNAALLGEFIPLEDLETQATELTTLLKIPLEIVD